MMRPLCVAARRTRAIVSAWPSCVPCEKLKRKTSTPASINSRMAASVLDAGPSVAMIFVFRTTWLTRVSTVGVRLPPSEARGGTEWQVVLHEGR